MRRRGRELLQWACPIQEEAHAYFDTSEDHKRQQKADPEMGHKESDPAVPNHLGGEQIGARSMVSRAGQREARAIVEA
jgi:hypothetical protein